MEYIRWRRAVRRKPYQVKRTESYVGVRKGLSDEGIFEQRPE